MKKPQKNTKENMYPIIDLWKESGLTQTQYCKQEKVSYYIFKYWLQKYRNEHIGAKQIQPAQFLPVQVPSSDELSKDPVSKDDITIHYPNGVKINCPVNIDTSLIKTLIKL